MMVAPLIPLFMIRIVMLVVLMIVETIPGIEPRAPTAAHSDYNTNDQKGYK
jgi:hypothetical protein